LKDLLLLDRDGARTPVPPAPATFGRRNLEIPVAGLYLVTVELVIADADSWRAELGADPELARYRLSVIGPLVLAYRIWLGPPRRERPAFPRLADARPG
jgi:hypothetical protein